MPFASAFRLQATTSQTASKVSPLRSKAFLSSSVITYRFCLVDPCPTREFRVSTYTDWVFECAPASQCKPSGTLLCVSTAVGTAWRDSRKSQQACKSPSHTPPIWLEPHDVNHQKTASTCKGTVPTFTNAQSIATKRRRCKFEVPQYSRLQELIDASDFTRHLGLSTARDLGRSG